MGTQMQISFANIGVCISCILTHELQVKIKLILEELALLIH